MTLYLLRRAVRGVAVLLLVALSVFGMGLLAGDPISLLVPVETTPEQLEALRAAHGLSDPVLVRLGRFLGEIARGDLGQSFRYRQPAVALVAERFAATLILTLAALAVTLVIALPAGIVSAVWKDSPVDAVVIMASVMGHSVPSFVLGLVLIHLFALHLQWLPTSGRGGWTHVVMPALTLGLLYAGRVARLLRASLLDVLHQEFVRTARAKGLAEWLVVCDHGLRNAMLPVVTILGLELGALLGGAVVTETVFAWPGIGKLAIDAVLSRDYPIIQAVVMVAGAGFVVVNLGVDLLCAWLDPRMRDV